MRAKAITRKRILHFGRCQLNTMKPIFIANREEYINPLACNESIECVIKDNSCWVKSSLSKEMECGWNTPCRTKS